MSCFLAFGVQPIAQRESDTPSQTGMLEGTFNARAIAAASFVIHHIPCLRMSTTRSKSSLLLSFLESVPDVPAKLKAPNAADQKFEALVKSAQDATVVVLVY